MMVDSSAVLAILQREPELEPFLAAIGAAEVRLISAVSVLECHLISLSRRRERGRRELDAFLAKTGLEIVAFDADQLAVARDAFAKFGKGRHPARLNFGDCCAYALAKARGLPLLFKGDDFGRTDVGVAG